ncbi:hypothetical protein GJ496_008383 [Pomphorhynchus laevis]|nr:hypothetical protein GJ496_008383 [Pomphorhynchus laevis]
MFSRARQQHSHSAKPKDTPFRQQRLPAWQPIMTIHSSLAIFFSIGIVFIPVGIACLASSNKVQMISVDYTDCTNEQNQKCSDIIDKDIYQKCICHLPISIEEPIVGDVYFYYGLERFWQNLRRFVLSRDDNQLIGSLGSVSSDTTPFRSPANSSKFYAPAGAIANSMFNDSFTLHCHIKHAGTINIVRVPWSNTGIAWQTDIAYKFKNPNTFDNTVKPMYWRKSVFELDPNNPDNNGYLNQDFIVWMRTAALPSFRKLHRILNRSYDAEPKFMLFNDSLPSGIYNLSIYYNYPVTSFKGRKLFIISSTSWLGSKNSFLGYAYISVGGICILTGMIFLVLHVNLNDRLGRHSDLFGN